MRALHVALSLSLLTAGCGRAMVAPLRYEPVPLALDEPFRAQAPDTSPPLPRADLPWRTRALPNGLRIAHLERRALPAVTVGLIVERGSADVGAPLDTYWILADLLDASTSVHSRSEIVNAWADLGAMRRVQFGTDASGLVAKVGAADIDAALSLMAETATRPAITQGNIDRARKAWSASIANQRWVSSAVVERTIRSLLFGREHAYGFDVRLVSSTRPLRAEDVGDLHGRFLQPALATLVVVGDVPADTVDALAARHFGAWTARTPSPTPRAAEAPPEVPGARVVLHPTRRDGGSLVAIVARGPAVTDPDHTTLEIIARAVGGLSSRLRGDVRESAAYSFGAGLSRHRLASIFSLRADLAPSATLPALRAMLAAVTHAAAHGIDAAELSRARTGLLADFRAAAATNDGIVALASAALASGRPIDDVARYPDRLAAVTLDDVRRVARRYLAEDRVRVVVVGDRSLAPELGNLGFGPPERVDEWGSPVPWSAR